MTKEQLGTLILDSERQMYSTAKSMLYSDQDCADAIQETIVKAFSGVHTLRNDKYAKTWLMRILINECYTILRKTSKVISLDEMCETTELAADEKSDYSDLYKAVGSLKEDLRMPVILYYIENFNISVIENYGNGGNYIPSLKPGESIQISMAWIVNESDLKEMYLNLNGTGASYQFDDEILANGIIDIRQN